MHSSIHYEPNSLPIMMATRLFSRREFEGQVSSSVSTAVPYKFVGGSVFLSLLNYKEECLLKDHSCTLPLQGKPQFNVTHACTQDSSVCITCSSTCVSSSTSVATEGRVARGSMLGDGADLFTGLDSGMEGTRQLRNLNWSRGEEKERGKGGEGVGGEESGWKQEG